MHPAMNMSLVEPGDGYSLRKTDNDVSVSVKSIKRVGGVPAMTRRIINVWESLPERYYLAGESWYGEAHEFAVGLAKTYEHSLWQVAQVIGVLSPQNPWEGNGGKRIGNKQCAVQFLDAWAYGGPELALSLRGWGFAPKFKEKAARVLLGDELSWDNAPKTYRFSLLIWNPHLDVVVVDSHSSRIATGNLGNRYHVVQPRAYRHIEMAYQEAGLLLNIPAREVQAGLWVAATEELIF